MGIRQRECAPQHTVFTAYHAAPDRSGTMAAAREKRHASRSAALRSREHGDTTTRDTDTTTLHGAGASPWRRRRRRAARDATVQQKCDTHSDAHHEKAAWRPPPERATSRRAECVSSGSRRPKPSRVHQQTPSFLKWKTPQASQPLLPPSTQCCRPFFMRSTYSALTLSSSSASRDSISLSTRP